MPDAPATKSLLIGPTRYLTGPGARHALGELAAGFGRRALIVHGEQGFPRVATDLRASLDRAGVAAAASLHAGPASAAAIADHVAAARAAGADAIVAVGGGRALDVGKSAAGELGLPCVTVPTSPATCAAATVAVVHYDPAGAYLHSRLLAELVLITIVDVEVLAAAPDRLLAAGVADAHAKVHEVRFVTGRSGSASVTVLAALALCDRLAGLLDEGAAAALAAGPAPSGDPARAAVAEAAVLLPALIGGLAGEDAKIAAAHAVHNALTCLPGSKGSLHGELVAYGVLVQRVLEGASPQSVRATADAFVALALPCGLEALGCGDARDAGASAVAERVVAAAEMRAAFPDVGVEDLTRAMNVADEAAVAAAAAATAEAGTPARAGSAG